MALLSTDFIAKLSTMELRAKTIVEGFIIGMHKSPYHGFSVEFAEYRPYMPGDPIKEIDWRVFGRTDRLYIKKHEEETNLKAYILLDKSSSMAFGTSAMTKLEYGASLASALSYLMIKQKDAVGLLLFDKVAVDYLPPSATRLRLFEILSRLEKLKPSGETNIKVALDSVAKGLRRRSLIILISDFLDDTSKVLSSLKWFTYAKNDVIAFHIIDPAERNFGYRRELIFEDLETRKRIQTQPWMIRKSYKQATEDFIGTLKYSLRESGIDYVQLQTDTPFELALLSYLYRRARLY